MEEFSQREHLQPVKDPLPVCPFRLSSLDDFQGLRAQICLTGKQGKLASFPSTPLPKLSEVTLVHFPV